MRVSSICQLFTHFCVGLTGISFEKVRIWSILLRLLLTILFFFGLAELLTSHLCESHLHSCMDPCRRTCAYDIFLNVIKLLIAFLLSRSLLGMSLNERAVIRHLNPSSSLLGDETLAHRWVQCGVLAGTTMTLLCILTIRPIRKRSYEIFLVVHFIFVL